MNILNGYLLKKLQHRMRKFMIQEATQGKRNIL